MGKRVDMGKEVDLAVAQDATLGGGRVARAVVGGGTQQAGQGRGAGLQAPYLLEGRACTRLSKTFY